MEYIVLYTVPYALGNPDFTLDDEELGASKVSSLFKDGEYYKPSGQLWCCFICAEAWMKVSVVNKDNQFSKYRILVNECEACTKDDVLLYQTRITLPGSILMEGYNTIDELSEEMLRRELLLELRAMKLLINQGVL